MTVNIAEDIHPITEHKRDTSAMIRRVNETGRPLVLTVNGKALPIPSSELSAPDSQLFTLHSSLLTLHS
jgi:prevent-host-death family protein